MLHQVSTYERFFWRSFLSASALLTWSFYLADAACGRPGRTILASHVPAAQVFEAGDTIQYRCLDEKHDILGNRQRTCLENGTWSEDIPVCLERIEIKEIKIPNEVPAEEANLSIDGNISTCIPQSIRPSTVWDGYLVSPSYVYAVRVLLKDKVSKNLRVRIDGDLFSSGKTCIYDSIRSESAAAHQSYKVMIFICPLDTYGKNIHLRDWQALSICEVSLFFQADQQCLIPDTPLNGYGRTISSALRKEYRFACDSGYKRWGALSVVCQPDGTWSPKSPVCEKIYCSAPIALENAQVNYNSSDGKIPYNGYVEFKCNDGFEMEGHSKLRCHHWETWDFEVPTCIRKTTTKGNSCAPFNVHTDNGEWISVNDTTAIRVLVCFEGFHIKGSLPISRCLFNGSWTYATATCVNSLEKNTKEETWNPRLVLISATAIGAGTALSILGISAMVLFLRKKFKTGRNPTIFHLKSPLHASGIRASKSNEDGYPSHEGHFHSVIELRTKTCASIRKSRSALPKLPLEEDPVYAQPFENDNMVQICSTINLNKTADEYSAHIYAEPENFEASRAKSTVIPINIRVSNSQNFSKPSFQKENSSGTVSDIENCEKPCAIYGDSLDHYDISINEDLIRTMENKRFSSFKSNSDYS